jgi:hypothetical protein
MHSCGMLLRFLKVLKRGNIANVTFLPAFDYDYKWQPVHEKDHLGDSSKNKRNDRFCLKISDKLNSCSQIIQLAKKK